MWPWPSSSSSSNWATQVRNPIPPSSSMQLGVGFGQFGAGTRNLGGSFPVLGVRDRPGPSSSFPVYGIRVGPRPISSFRVQNTQQIDIGASERIRKVIDETARKNELYNNMFVNTNAVPPPGQVADQIRCCFCPGLFPSEDLLKAHKQNYHKDLMSSADKRKDQNQPKMRRGKNKRQSKPTCIHCHKDDFTSNQELSDHQSITWPLEFV